MCVIDRVPVRTDCPDQKLQRMAWRCTVVLIQHVMHNV